MIVVHDTFIAKPGNASKLAKLFKEVMADGEEHVEVLTDMTGQYNRVIMVSKYENLAAFEASFQKYMQDTPEMQKMREKMKGYTDMYQAGSREIFRIW
ncbi:MAG TPA: antibiotic biosynthesis monooxygenase [Puia sp.]|nr:antibiotic biosynthesis monooxygenase [Puia sp.]